MTITPDNIKDATLKDCDWDYEAMILWAYAHGNKFVRVPRDMLPPMAVVCLMDNGFAIKPLWYVAYEPGYVISWE